MPAATHVTNTDTVTTSVRTLEDAGFTTAQIRAAKRMWLTGVGGDLRYFMAGSTPTTSFGHICQDGVTYEFPADGGGDFSRFQCIQASATVVVTYELEYYV